MNTEILNRSVNVFLKGEEAYVMWEGELTKVTIVCTKYFVDGDYSVPVVCFPDNVHHVLTKSDKLYLLAEDFENNKPMSTREFNLNRLLPFDDGSYWIFKDGEPEEVKPIIDFLVIYNPWYGASNLVNGKPMCEEWYGSREEAIKWNDYTIVESDGSKHIRKSKLRQLKLTDEQRTLVEQLSEAFKAVQDSGVILSFDDCDVLHAYNGKNVAKHCWNVGCDMNDTDDFVDANADVQFEVEHGNIVYSSECLFTVCEWKED